MKRREQDWTKANTKVREFWCPTSGCRSDGKQNTILDNGKKELRCKKCKGAFVRDFLIQAQTDPE
jgi:hypothetical protein